MKRLAAGAALVLSIALAACGGDSEETAGGPNLSASPSGGIDIRGEITQLATPEANVSLGALVVQGEEYPDTKYHRRAAIRMKDTTVIQRKQGEDIFPASVVDLEIGKRVDVKFVGPVAELATVQAAAGEITILE
jgi:hypothetical protein